MPNNCTNQLKIKSSDGSNASSDRIDAVVEFCKSEKDGEQSLDFNKIIPMPEELLIVRSPIQIVPQKEHDEAVKKREEVLAKDSQDMCDIMNISLPLTVKLDKAYKKKYRANNWYDWAIQNWGTKWNAYDIYSDNWESDGEIEFCTAWSPPSPVIEKLSTIFPDLIFELGYADEGCGFVGRITFQNGEAQDDYCSDNYESSEFRELYFEITGTDLNEHDEHDEECDLQGE
jgi:hypothetical protein